MFVRFPALVLAFAALSLTGVTFSQTVQIPPPKEEPPPGRDVVAARVNGEAIPELAVYRSLMRVPLGRRDEARREVVNFLIDNMIVDQYLVQLKIQIDGKEIDEAIAKIKKEAADSRKDFKKLLEELMITEAELRTNVTAALRWDKFVLQQGSEKVLHDYFKNNLGMFNGSETKARHILIAVSDGKKDDALAKITIIKKKIEDEVSLAIAKMPAGIQREQERVKALDAAFAKAAIESSSCPSKKDGGDLGYFPRAGAMVEPFARAAFALKQYEMSPPVATEFGYHLILALDTKAGKEVKYDDVKPFVQEVYGERLREAVLTQYKAKSKIEIVEKKK
jgi:parvulin-like peptidyl-prolyl isomerase